MFRWTMSKDRTQRADVRIVHRLSHEDMARLLIARYAGQFRYDESKRVTVEVRPGRFVQHMTAKGMIQMVRGELRNNGTSRADFWQDKFGDYPGQPTVNDVWTWALLQVARL